MDQDVAAESLSREAELVCLITNSTEVSMPSSLRGNSGKSCTGGSPTSNELEFIASSSKGPQPHSRGGRSSHRREIEVLPVKLVKADVRQLYSPSCSVFTDTLHHTSSADFSPCSSYIREVCYTDTL